MLAVVVVVETGEIWEVWVWEEAKIIGAIGAQQWIGLALPRLITEHSEVWAWGSVTKVAT